MPNPSGLIAAAALCVTLAAAALFAREIVNTDDQKVATEGYDPVAYHVAGRLFPGASPGATTHFLDDTPAKTEAARENRKTLGQAD